MSGPGTVRGVSGTSEMTTCKLTLKDVTAQDAQASLASLSFTRNTKGCRLASKASGHRNKYVKLKIKGKAAREEFYLQQLAVIASGRGRFLETASHGGPNECSHLCREVTCFNPEHIVVEPKETNKSRNFCVQLACACGSLVTNCKHEPACIF